jgi:hypothetical protein
MVLLCAACTREKGARPSEPRPELQPALTWLSAHYRKAPLKEGWSVSSVSSQGDRLQVTVDIPPEQASPIMRRPADDQFRLVAERVCPAPADELWRLLPPGSGVTVLPSVSGQVFIEVRCGR